MSEDGAALEGVRIAYVYARCVAELREAAGRMREIGEARWADALELRAEDLARMSERHVRLVGARP